MDKKLPIYRATIDDTDNTGMFVVSLVDEPAVDVNFFAFDKQEEQLEFAIQDEEQRMVLGVVMRPNYPMYRRFNNMECYVEYTPETIHLMVEKFFATMNVNNVDTDHSWELVDGVTLVQAFFKDTEKGIDPKGFEDMPNDTLFFQYHITSDEIWQGVKEGKWHGFSLAGAFNVEPIEAKKEEPKDDVLGDIQSLLEKINNKLR